MILPTYLHARGFYLSRFCAGEISAKTYHRTVRAIAAAERASMHNAERIAKQREAVRRSKAKAKLRQQLKQSLEVA